MVALDLQNVQTVAYQEGWKRILLSYESRVISFRKEEGNDDGSNSNWNCGNPRIHTGGGYYRKVGRSNVGGTANNDVSCQDLEKEVKLQIERLDTELKAIQDERSRVQEILDNFEQERKRKAQEEKEKLEAAKRKAEADERERAAKKRKEEEDRKQALIDSKRYSRGKYLDYSLFDADFVSACFNEQVVSMACGGEATIMLYENGGWAWTSGLTKNLHNKLNGRQRTLPSPTYVAMGSMDRYYIKFADGKSEWVGCEDMSGELNVTNRVVKSVAFGTDWDSYFIVYTDGWWKCNGSIPNALKNLLTSRNNKADLECVSLGPEGEYYIQARNGRAWWGGMSDDNFNIANGHKNEIRLMDFGDDDTFFLRYS